MWSNCNLNLKSVIIKQQKRMGRIILKVDTRTPTVEVLRRLRWVSIEDRWKFQKLKVIFNALNGNSPKYLTDLFQISANVHTYRTRNASSLGISIPRVRTEKGKRRLSIEGSLLWNDLPQSVRNTNTIATFISAYWRMPRL